MDDGGGPDGAGRHGLRRPVATGTRAAPLQSLGGDAVQRGQVDQLAIDSRDAAEVGAAQSRRALADDVEDRLDVGRGARDHPQDLAGRRLLLEGLGQIAFRASSSWNSRTFSMAMTAWSANVVDQLDLLVGERLHCRPTDHEDPDDRALPEHRNGEDGPDLGAALPLGPAVLGIGHGVVDVDDAVLEERPARRRLPTGTVRV